MDSWRYRLVRKSSVTFIYPRVGVVRIRRGEEISQEMYDCIPERFRSHFDLADADTKTERR